jgi:hypothetical protein
MYKEKLPIELISDECIYLCIEKRGIKMSSNHAGQKPDTPFDQSKEEKKFVEQCIATKVSSAEHALLAFKLGRAVERLEYYQDVDSLEIPPMQDFPSMEILRIAQQKDMCDKDLEWAVYEAALPFMWASFRYGYYQAITDK